MRTHWFFLLSIFLIWIACRPAPASSTENEHAAAEIETLFEAYYEEWLKLNPLEATSTGDPRYNNLYPNTLTTSYRKDLSKFYSSYKDRLGQIDREKLSKNDQVSYDLLLWTCNLNLEELKFPTHLLPISQISSSPQLIFGRMASGQSTQPFETVKDYDDWLQRLDAFTTWCDTAIVNMRLGIQEGYVLPAKLIEKTIPPIDGWSQGKVEEHLFYQPINLMPEEIPETEKQRLTTAYQGMVQEKIIPTFKKLATFLHDEYLPAGRSTSGVGDLPNGKAYYDHQIKKYTTTSQTAAEIFELGQQEVARIEEEMKQVMQEVAFEGDLPAFFEYVRNREASMPFTESQEVIDYYYGIYERMKPRLKVLFDQEPKTAFEIRRTEAFREKTSAAQYVRGSNDGTRPGIFYVPIPDVTKAKGSESLFLHEAIPGHHYQISLQIENETLPEFRRNFRSSSFSEGWALYAESLGRELGLYTDPYQYFDMLNSEIFRAVRLVVDAGLHSKGWSREQAIQYCLDHSAFQEAQVISEIERYMAFPGQALSYKVGQLKFLALRSKAQQELGEDFDIKAFHHIILETAIVPLEILEQVIDDWIAEESQEK